MKTVRHHEFGSSDVLVYEDAPRPVPGAGEVLVKVAGTAFNPVDAAIRAGYLQEVFPVALPHVPGIDVAGTIAEVGDGVQGWGAGDAVVAFLPVTADGAAAEYVSAPAELLAAAPASVEPADAAALPSAALTAWQSLFEHGGLKAGQTLLVNGAGGGVGGYAVQLAKQAGAVVTATASGRSADRVRGYGADRIIDYTATPVVESAGERYDVVLNLVTTSPEETAALVGLVADGGVLASTTTPAEPDAARGVRAARVFARSDAGRLAELTARVDAGTLRVHVAERVRLAELPALHSRSEAGTLAGKSVVTP